MANFDTKSITVSSTAKEIAFEKDHNIIIGIEITNQSSKHVYVDMSIRGIDILSNRSLSESESIYLPDGKHVLDKTDTITVKTNGEDELISVNVHYFNNENNLPINQIKSANPIMDSASITLSGDTEINEGTKGVFTIHLDKIPQRNLTVNLGYTGDTEKIDRIFNVVIPQGQDTIQFELDYIDDRQNGKESFFTIYVINAYGGGFDIIECSQHWEVKLIPKPPFYDSLPSQPSILEPTYGAANVPVDFTFNSSIFSIVDSRSNDFHQGSHWQIALQETFVNIIYETEPNDTVNKTSWKPDNLLGNTTFYVRVRYLDSSGDYSEWSDHHKFTTEKVDIISTPNQPVINSPVSNSILVSVTPVFYSSLYENSHYASKDIHMNSEWHVSMDENFNTVKASSGVTPTSLTSWDCDQELDSLTQYYVRVRYQDSSGDWSQWSPSVSFVTEEVVIVSVPNPPAIISPTSNSILSLTPTFVSSVYTNSNSESTETHAGSDWELSTNSAFTVVVDKSGDSNTHLNEWAPIPLDDNKQYFVRVRYKDSSGDWSSWSPYLEFTTETVSVVKPRVISPSAQNNEVNITFHSSEFNLDNDSSPKTHSSSSWELATDSQFVNVIASEEGSDVLTSWDVSGLQYDNTYYVRVKFMDNTNEWSEWSDSYAFSTRIDTGDKPTVFNMATISNDANVMSSEYSGNHTHTTSDWQIALDVNFTNLHDSTVNDFSNLTSWYVSNLEINTDYYVRVRYKDNAGYTDWSNAMKFTTVSIYIGMIDNDGDIYAGDVFGEKVFIAPPEKRTEAMWGLYDYDVNELVFNIGADSYYNEDEVEWINNSIPLYLCDEDDIYTGNDQNIIDSCYNKDGVNRYVRLHPTYNSNYWSGREYNVVTNQKQTLVLSIDDESAAVQSVTSKLKNSLYDGDIVSDNPQPGDIVGFVSYGYAEGSGGYVFYAHKIINSSSWDSTNHYDDLGYYPSIFKTGVVNADHSSKYYTDILINNYSDQYWFYNVNGTGIGAYGSPSAKHCRNLGYDMPTFLQLKTINDNIEKLKEVDESISSGHEYSLKAIHENESKISKCWSVHELSSTYAIAPVIHELSPTLGDGMTIAKYQEHYVIPVKIK